MTNKEKAMVILEKLDSRSMNINWNRADGHIKDIVEAFIEIEREEAKEDESRYRNNPGLS